MNLYCFGKPIFQDFFFYKYIPIISSFSFTVRLFCLETFVYWGFVTNVPLGDTNSPRTYKSLRPLFLKLTLLHFVIKGKYVFCLKIIIIILVLNLPVNMSAYLNIKESHMCACRWLLFIETTHDERTYFRTFFKLINMK